MLDLRFVRQNPEVVRAALRRRRVEEGDLDALLEADARWRRDLQRLEELRAQRNETSEAIGRLRRQGADASELIAAMRRVGETIKELEERVRRLEQEIQERLLRIPMIPDPDVPEGDDAEDNVEVRRWGEPPRFDFEPKAHWDLGPALGILDFERAAKITGARFTVFRDRGARLVRALIQFMLDLHTQEHGYTEVLPPFLVHRQSMVGTGQLPKFEDDAFRVADSDLFLVPTAEVPVTNLYRDEILDAAQLPIYHVAYTPCFRAEAGSAGRDTRGLIRQHQFDKVELVKFVHPDRSAEEHERLVADAEAVLQRLGLPYRVVLICTGDMGFAQAKQYDLEVWMPSYGRYVEISSCSNYRDYQARRANIRFRPEPGARPRFVHTLNGSGLAVGRTLAALLENYQQADGSVVIPEALRPYMGGVQRLQAG
ncbi:MULTISPECIES: serine--tRNA ligase [Thermaerobacter]|uniref:Serine--tRNA ligase n=1 Tax=Thermaerobacter composti TaxID=554949 RepID=A0ABZ0QNQ5_9FIRM|nr:MULTISPECIES: serine--tRNA ligase [Thermaerobacter]PZN06651.1 MAG: serine--tRNA ligase [Bacillota bacterium]QBS37107.1 serine--tRNA ligase [Thermaerobacter sp. FW80]WPD19123.1 serine--tRNA ligase [Thermaerobacter composti]